MKIRVPKPAKVLLGLVFVLMLLVVGVAGVSFEGRATSSRRSAHESAEATFGSLNFSFEGRGMHISPGIINQLSIIQQVVGEGGDFYSFMRRRWGINNQEDGRGGRRLVGIFKERYKGMDIGVLGCVACHSGRAAGQYIIGIGNKNVDVGQIGADAVRVEEYWKRITDSLFYKSPDYRAVEEGALYFARKLNHPQLRSHTQGHVPISIIRSWFYEQAKEPLPEDMTLAPVKVPHPFGYGEKRKVGQFSDAFGYAARHESVGWGLAVEFTAGQTVAGVRQLLPKAEMAEAILGDLLPPKYPSFYPLNFARAEAGKQVFDKTCARCHGTYEDDVDGYPVYKQPKLIPQKVVGTDSNRLDSLDERFLDLVRSSPLADVATVTENAGRRLYVAPRLHAVWARFPYLHNGSVPTLRDLLRPASERPRFFSLAEAGEAHRFDAINGGLTVSTEANDVSELASRAAAGARDVFDVSRVGSSNQGHEFFTDLSAEEKESILEYLKTL